MGEDYHHLKGALVRTAILKILQSITNEKALMVEVGLKSMHLLVPHGSLCGKEMENKKHGWPIPTGTRSFMTKLRMNRLQVRQTKFLASIVCTTRSNMSARRTTKKPIFDL